MTLNSDSLHELVRNTLLHPGFRRGTFGGAVRGVSAGWVRVTVRPLQLRGEPHLQFTYFDGRKDISRNVPMAEVQLALSEVLAVSYSGIHLETESEEIDLRTSKKGKVFVGRKAATRQTPIEAHNRVKNQPLPEGQADWLLEVMGIATADGRIKPTMRAKFTQINEFLKHLMHLLDDAGLKSLGRPLEILDCGCGSSHLTLAAHHYLNDILAIPTRLIGVDVNEEVIRTSMQKAERIGAVDVNFACGRIQTVDAKPDVVLALHACDTATDDALARAVHADAKLILSVPCCHHHLNELIRSEVLRPILRHGILHQRAADLTTDAFRALALRIMGYRTDVVEFISPEHTARNLMIRAVRGVPAGEAAFIREYRELKQFWGATPYIENALGESFQQIVAEHGE